MPEEELPYVCQKKRYLKKRFRDAVSVRKRRLCIGKKIRKQRFLGVKRWKKYKCFMYAKKNIKL